jgi:Flp pilus assembly protein TadG
MPGSFAVMEGRALPARSWAPKRLFRTFRESEDGQALVELALVLPVVLLILFGILDFGRALNTKNTTNHLANLGARLAAVGTVPSESTSLCEYINKIAAPSNLKEKLGVTVTEETPPTVGSPVTVKVTNNYHWLKFIEGTVKVTVPTPVAGEATMRLENTANGSVACSLTAPS